MLGVVGSSLKMVKLEPKTPNMLQLIATAWPNACCDMLSWHLAIVWPGLTTAWPKPVSLSITLIFEISTKLEHALLSIFLSCVLTILHFH